MVGSADVYAVELRIRHGDTGGTEKTGAAWMLEISIAPHVGEQRQVLVDRVRVAFVSPGRPLCWIIPRGEAAALRERVERAIEEELGERPPAAAFAPPLEDRDDDWGDLEFDDDE